ncbi:glycosyl transferase [Fictibacillus phosphorivorans]|uniref:Glycosyl transferase n=1 Tax=Fictibacillus phosphorivorans TaxID=1221500 RepID=A0A165N1D5_9BACL|nr:glycosyltransferase [Fictibacillus phosphorivorans]KZE64230.1 glycosyl transferase [Fictibacillus phosphorivorans]
MKTEFNYSFPPRREIRKPLKKKIYIPIITKFWTSHIIAFLWMAFSIYVSIPWLDDLSEIVTFPIALFIITGISYVPGYLNAFLVISLFFDKQPPFKNEHPNEKVSVLIAARNEEEVIARTLRYISKQDYSGPIEVFVIDNASTDKTFTIAANAGIMFNLDVRVIKEEVPGKFNALNTALKSVTTNYVITLDADTILHQSAIRLLVARITSSPANICAVAGSVLVRNSRGNLLARIQEWDYFLGIASIKRLQGLYQGTLVAQGAFSIYDTQRIKDMGGWPDAIGEDIVLTWNLLKKGWKVYFEPLAVAFTDVPDTLTHFAKQRSRWARGMIEALKQTKPWEQPEPYIKYLTGINLIMPYLDIVYTFCWLPGLILSFFGYYWIVGLTTLLVLPLTLISYGFLYYYQKNVFKRLELRIRKNILGFFVFVCFYQMLMSPISTWGYIQEAFKLKRVWK